jgi:hypothetical protein
MVHALIQGGGTAEDYATRMEAQMAALGIRPVKDNKPINDAPGVKAHIAELVAGYIAEDVPSLIRLGILVAA